MERGKMSSTGRGGKSKAPQHPQDIFALGSKSTVVVSRDSEKRNIHKPSTSGVGERKRETTGFGSQPPSKRTRIGSPAESISGTSLEIDPVDLVPNVLQALDTHNSDKLLGLLTGSIRLLKSQRSKPDPILCMSMLYLTKIRPNMFAHETVTQTICTLLKREQGTAFKSKGNPLVFVLACNMLYAGHKDSNNWPDIFIKVYIEDALNERWWIDCAWCKCLVENIVTAFGTKQPPPHLIPSDNTLGTMSPSGSGSPLMGSTEDDTDNTDLEYSVFPRYSSNSESVEGMVLEAIKEQIQRRAAPDALGKGFLKLLSATCGFPEIRMIAATRLEAWLHSGKLWRAAQELLAYVCANVRGVGASAARDHEVLAQLARMRLKTKPLQAAYQACLRDMVADSPPLLRPVVTHAIYNELSGARAPHNAAVLGALVAAAPTLAPAAAAEAVAELAQRGDELLRPLRALSRELARAGGAGALLPLARALAAPPPPDPPASAFAAVADLLAHTQLLAAHARPAPTAPEPRALLPALQQLALGWLLDAAPAYRPSRTDLLAALHKITFVEPPDAYAKPDNWPPEAERAALHRACCEAPLPQNTLLRVAFVGLSGELAVSPGEALELLETLVRRAAALPPEEAPLPADKLELAEYVLRLAAWSPPEGACAGAPPLAVAALYWRAWLLLTLVAAHNPSGFAERASAAYPTLRALIECCITGKGSIEWLSASAEAERVEAERVAASQVEAALGGGAGGGLAAQLMALEPAGPARRPPAAVLDALLQLATALRLPRLLCRAPALLLRLVERHGTRRALPWLHTLLRHERLELGALPVQCLCELLAAGGADAKATELARHLRQAARDPAAAPALLAYYTARLAHEHAATRAAAGRGLKLVLSQSEDITEMDYNADVSPESWLELLEQLPHWEALRADVVRRVRAACLVECSPAHVAAYFGFLARHALEPDSRAALTDLVLDLSQVVMERGTVMSHVLPPDEALALPPDLRRHQHQALHHITTIFYTHLRQVLSSNELEEEEEAGGEGAEAEEEGEGEGGSAWSGGEKITLQWANGRVATMHLVIAHAHLKLLCYGPSLMDTNREMYSWLQATWVGEGAPGAGGAGAALLPDWLRLALVRSARPPLLAAGLRALPAHQLALFIQTFGMPVASMSALLCALDACPAGAVVRLEVERGYMAQLLRVQRARGATGGAAFAAALRLTRPQLPPDDTLFAEEPLPEEEDDPWSDPVVPSKLEPSSVEALLSTAFEGAATYRGDIDLAFTQLHTVLSEEGGCGPSAAAAVRFLSRGAAAPGLLRRPALAAPLLRALAELNPPGYSQVSNMVLSVCKCVRGPVSEALRAAAPAPAPAPALAPALPHSATKHQIIAAFESSTPSTLELIGNKIIETQDTQVVADAITHLLVKNQEGCYELPVKCEAGDVVHGRLVHVLSAHGLGAGLLLDWLAELQRETAGRQEAAVRLMFTEGGAAWRALLVTLLAHRASWRTLHACLRALLQPDRGWSPKSVLDFAETLIGSPRLWQGRDRTTPKHHVPEDSLRLTHQQLEVLVQYIGLEAAGAEAAGGAEGARRRMEARLPLLLRCCATAPALLTAARAAACHHPPLLPLLHLKVPKVLQLLLESEERVGGVTVAEAIVEAGAAVGSRACTSATDRVSHALLTALAAPAPHSKENSHKAARAEAAVRALWARGHGAGGRALPLAGALLRGLRARHSHLLAAIEVLPDRELFAGEEIHSVLEGFLELAGGAQAALAHRVAALLRRYRAARPHRAQQLLVAYRDTIANCPGLAGAGGGGEAASGSPPPHALAALRRRTAPPDELLWHLQEVEAWGVRRGGAWGGAGAADALVRAAAPLAAHAHAPLRAAAAHLLARLLPAATDTAPGLQVIMECLDSDQPEIAQSILDKLPELIVAIQEHAARILMQVFQLGMKSRLPVETCLAKCVATINLHRGC